MQGRALAATVFSLLLMLGVMLGSLNSDHQRDALAAFDTLEQLRNQLTAQVEAAATSLPLTLSQPDLESPAKQLAALRQDFLDTLQRSLDQGVAALLGFRGRDESLREEFRSRLDALEIPKIQATVGNIRLLYNRTVQTDAQAELVLEGHICAALLDANWLRQTWLPVLKGGMGGLPESSCGGATNGGSLSVVASEYRQLLSRAFNLDRHIQSLTAELSAQCFIDRHQVTHHNHPVLLATPTILNAKLADLENLAAQYAEQLEAFLQLVADAEIHPLQISPVVTLLCTFSPAGDYALLFRLIKSVLPIDELGFLQKQSVDRRTLSTIIFDRFRDKFVPDDVDAGLLAELQETLSNSEWERKLALRQGYRAAPVDADESSGDDQAPAIAREMAVEIPARLAGYFRGKGKDALAAVDALLDIPAACHQTFPVEAQLFRGAFNRPVPTHPDPIRYLAWRHRLALQHLWFKLDRMATAFGADAAGEALSRLEQSLQQSVACAKRLRNLYQYHDGSTTLGRDIDALYGVVEAAHKIATALPSDSALEHTPVLAEIQRSVMAILEILRRLDPCRKNLDQLWKIIASPAVKRAHDGGKGHAAM